VQTGLCDIEQVSNGVCKIEAERSALLSSGAFA